MLTVPQLIAENAARWGACKILPVRGAEANKVARRLCATIAKDIYLDIAQRTGVPWFVIAVIHEREAGGDFSRSLAQGDPWNAVSWHVPKGRGPFANFAAAAIDALTECPPHAALWKDWTAGGALTLLEEYNGLGYEEYHAEASPYIWGGTDQQQRGKYIGDHLFDASRWDSQLGCAALLKAMMALDPSVKFTGTSPEPYRSAPLTPPPPFITPATHRDVLLAQFDAFAARVREFLSSGS